MKENIKIAGSGVISSGEYKDVRISGAAKITGDIVAESIKISGSVKAEGELKANEIKIAGSCKALGDLKAKTVSISGSVNIEANIDAEDLKIAGIIKCSGDLNGENIYVDSKASTLNNVFGENIFIGMENGRNTWLKANEVNLIEATKVEINHCKVKTIRATDIVIDINCTVDVVEYSGTCEVHEKSKVKELIKV